MEAYRGHYQHDQEIAGSVVGTVQQVKDTCTLYVEKTNIILEGLFAWETYRPDIDVLFFLGFTMLARIFNIQTLFGFERSFTSGSYKMVQLEYT